MAPKYCYAHDLVNRKVVVMVISCARSTLDLQVKSSYTFCFRVLVQHLLMLLHLSITHAPQPLCGSSKTHASQLTWWPRPQHSCLPVQLDLTDTASSLMGLLHGPNAQ